jgi:hypothetical protein
VFCAAHFVFRSTKPLAPAVFRYSVNFNATEHAEFLSRFNASGMKVKAHFIDIQNIIIQLRNDYA